MKKVLSILLAMCLTLHIAVLPASAANTAGFTDVPDNWARPAIDYCLEKGLMSGVGSGRFNPGGNVNRAQIAQALYNRENSPGIAGLENPFTDVGSQWFAEAVIWCRANGIVNGSTASTFNPTGQVTRQDICVMAYNYYTKHLKGTAEMTDESVMSGTFTDWAKVAGYAKEAVRWANKTAFMSGASATTLNPAGKATRAQLAQFLMNLDRVLENEKEPEPTPTAEPSPSAGPSSTPKPTVEPSADPTAPPSGVFPLSMKKPQTIIAGPKQTLAIRSDGTVAAAGLNEAGGLNVGG